MDKVLLAVELEIQVITTQGSHPSESASRLNNASLLYRTQDQFKMFAILTGERGAAQCMVVVGSAPDVGHVHPGKCSLPLLTLEEDACSSLTPQTYTHATHATKQCLSRVTHAFRYSTVFLELF
jgi:hypothetical protein